MNAHKEKKHCTCGECGGVETMDYYLVAGQPVARECYERNQRRMRQSDTGRATSPVRHNGQDVSD